VWIREKLGPSLPWPGFERKNLAVKTLLASSLLALMCVSWAVAGTYGPYAQETYKTCGPATARLAAVLIHGGAWFPVEQYSTTVDKVCTFLGQRNVYVVAIDYRPATVAPWPAQLQDAQLAVRWLRRNSVARSVGVIGLSSGGQVALSTAFQTRITYDRTDPGNEADLLAAVSSHPDFVVDVSGPTDLTQTGVLPKGVAALTAGTGMSTPAAEAFASPIVHITTLTAPLFMSHGIEDDIVPVDQADSLADALQKAGVSVFTMDSGSGTRVIPPADATVVYDRHPGKHLFGGARVNRILEEIYSFIRTRSLSAS